MRKFLRTCAFLHTCALAPVIAQFLICVLAHLRTCASNSALGQVNAHLRTCASTCTIAYLRSYALALVLAHLRNFTFVHLRKHLRTCIFKLDTLHITTVNCLKLFFRTKYGIVPLTNEKMTQPVTCTAIIQLIFKCRSFTS